MLSPEEFLVGVLGHAVPLSLVLPRNEHEQVFLVGQSEGSPAAVCLSPKYQFESFPSTDNQSWKGIIIPKVRIEVDEESVFDADAGAPLGTVIRTGEHLVLRSRGENSVGRRRNVLLHGGLGSGSEYSAGFFKWQIVVGEGMGKRVLHTVCAKTT